MPVLNQPDTSTVDETMFRSLYGSDSPWAVLLFNDEVHTFQDVAGQLQKAIGCTWDEGMGFASIVDREGQAKVFEGDLETCERVASVLEEIRLQVKLEVQ